MWENLLGLLTNLSLFDKQKKKRTEACVSEHLCDHPLSVTETQTHAVLLGQFNLGLFGYQIGHLCNVNLVFYSKSPVIHKQTSKG